MHNIFQRKKKKKGARLDYLRPEVFSIFGWGEYIQVLYSVN